VNEGVDWFNLLGSKNELSLNLAIRTTILNTPDVTGLQELLVNLSDNRIFSVTYRVTTAYEGSQNPIAESIGYIITESGDIFTTESGDQINA
jgi:hypothetical protein